LKSASVSDRSSSRVVLHVGPPKTGTSALQVFFAQNASALHRLGVLYPRIDHFDIARRGKVAAGNGVGLAKAIIGISSVGGEDLERRQGLVRDLLHQLRVDAAGNPDASTILLSSEYFAEPTTSDLLVLRELVAASFRDLRIVSVHRDPIPLLCSIHEQQTKGAPANPDSLEAFWAGNGRAFLEHRLRTPLRYADAVGDDRVSVVRYLSPGKGQQSLIQSVLEAVTGLDADVVARFLEGKDVTHSDGPVHRSLGPVGRELVRLCNIAGAERKVVAQLYAAIDRATPAHLRTEVAVSDALRQDIIDGTKSTIEEVAVRLRPEDAGDLIASAIRQSPTLRREDHELQQLRDEMDWVLQGVALTVARFSASRRTASEVGAAESLWPDARSQGFKLTNMLQRLRRNIGVRSVAIRLPHELRASMNRFFDRLLVDRSS
jgi:hypothetical protein